MSCLPSKCCGDFAADSKNDGTKRVPVEKAGDRLSKDKDDTIRRPKTSSAEGVPTESLEKDHSKANIDIVVKETSAGRAGWHSLTFWYDQESNCFSNYGLHNTEMGIPFSHILVEMGVLFLHPSCDIQAYANLFYLLG